MDLKWLNQSIKENWWVMMGLFYAIVFLMLMMGTVQRAADYERFQPIIQKFQHNQCLVAPDNCTDPYLICTFKNQSWGIYNGSNRTG